MEKNWDASYDLVIVGSGGALCGALLAGSKGKRVLVLEKTDKVGGSTALSGGVLWVPNNPVMARAGVKDTPEAAKAYLDACVADTAPPFSEPRRAAYLREGPKVVGWLESMGMKFLHAEGYSDYHEAELPGGVARSRSLVAEIFDLNELGELSQHMRRRAVVIPVSMHELPAITRGGNSLSTRIAMVKVGLRMLRNKLGARLGGMGYALQGRMLQLLQRQKTVELWRESPVTALVEEGGRVAGVVATRNGKEMRIRATQGVLVDAGGFSHNLPMREKYQQKPASVSWTNANPGDTGEVLEMMVRAGAGLGNLEMAVWVPTSLMPDGSRSINASDISKPHCIVVDAKGERIVNESTSYMKFGRTLYSAGAVPAWCISESRNRRYRWGGYPPGDPPAAWLSSGYMKKAGTLAELAKLCGIDAAGLQKTVERFNGFARNGVDEDFGRGKSSYNRFWGDPDVKPNPNLGAIEQGPFYAIALYPGDVGTCGGVLTDEHSRVLRADGAVIGGLYAAGNCTAAFTGGSYPGAGASIGGSMVFSYLAAQHALSQPASVQNEAPVAVPRIATAA